MATSLSSSSFQRNLLLSVGGIFLLFALSFSLWQYGREKTYKTTILHSRLQTYCYELVQALGPESLRDSLAFSRYVEQHPMKGLRVTVMNAAGRVLQDSRERNVSLLGNHLERVEVAQALKQGHGYVVKRVSESTRKTYFYSATRFGSLVVRAAVPYTPELIRSLEVDYTYLFFVLGLTLLLGMVLYYHITRIGRHIEWLRAFAVKAERGEELDRELERRLPDDELGEISHIIGTLYWKLRHAENDKVRLKRQLTQNAAHELKTPTASIHGYLESILEHPDMPAEQRQRFLERCYAQSKRMSKLLLDMTALTKLDDMTAWQVSGGGGQTVDVKEVVAHVLDDVALQVEERGLALSLHLPERVEVPGDTSVIYSIFRNLVDNALAYAVGATRLGILCAECEEEDGIQYYEFVVSDNGVGVPPDHLDRLFERFYRVDKGRSRKLGGTGLGLAIVRNAVAAHGGTATAQLTPGGGLTIRFTLAKA